MLSRITVAGFGFSKFTSPQPPGTQAIPAGGEGQQIENTSMPNCRRWSQNEPPGATGNSQGNFFAHPRANNHSRIALKYSGHIVEDTEFIVDTLAAAQLQQSC